MVKMQRYVFRFYFVYMYYNLGITTILLMIFLRSRGIGTIRINEVVSCTEKIINIRFRIQSLVCTDTKHKREYL